ncbi:MAG: exopolyphosphatase, partial [Casimicrobium sp.]
TEFVIGRGYEPSFMESFLLGAVTLSQNFFPDGLVTAAAFRKAEMFVRSRLEVMRPQYKRGWDVAYGSSGTVRAIYEIVTENNFGTALHQDALTALRDRLVEVGRMDRVELNALKTTRAPVLPGGLAILLGLARELSVKQIEPTDGALRLGTLYDLLARRKNGELRFSDTRYRTIERLQRRYDVDATQATRVDMLAQQLWKSLGQETPDSVLTWVASLHEIGMAIAHEDYHRHSSYIVENAELPGFSERERNTIAWLVLGHTGSLKKLERDRVDSLQLQRLLCLRIAAIFAHGRTDVAARMSLRARGESFEVALPTTLRDSHPLTHLLIEEECERWRKWGRTLSLRET